MCYSLLWYKMPQSVQLHLPQTLVSSPSRPVIALQMPTSFALGETEGGRRRGIKRVLHSLPLSNPAPGDILTLLFHKLFRIDTFSTVSVKDHHVHFSTHFILASTSIISTALPMVTTDLHDTNSNKHIKPDPCCLRSTRHSFFISRHSTFSAFIPQRVVLPFL